MTEPTTPSPAFTAPELGALAHLYRGEMYRSKIWRQRLDTTTNWAVATTGIALSVSFAQPENSPLPLILVTLLVVVFMVIEARRYRYFDIWRTRVRLLEVCLYGPILRGEGVQTENGWTNVLAQDYEHVHFHISFWEAAGRRLRRNFIWIFLIQGISYLGKILISPEPVGSLAELWTRASIGPLPGQLVLSMGVVFHGSLLALALLTMRKQYAAGRVTGPEDQDPMLRFGIKV